MKERELDVRAISSGLNVNRLNSGDFQGREVEFYLQMVLGMEPYLADSHSFLDGVKAICSQNSFEDQDALKLARQSLWYIDIFCVRMCERALRNRGIEYDGSVQIQTRPREDVDAIVTLQRSYSDQIHEIYNETGHPPRIITVEEIGPRPLPVGFELKDFEAVVDTALENAPKILDMLDTQIRR